LETAVKYLTRQRAAEYLTEKGIPTTEQSLADRARSEGGPRYGLIGYRALYTAADLDAWVAERLARPTLRQRRKAARGQDATA
jgi:hypothetical protein